MTLFRSFSWICALSLALLIAASSPGFAQLVVKGDVGKPKAAPMPSPDIADGAIQKRFKPKDWLEIEVEFELDARGSDGEKPDFVDQIEVKYYVAVANGQRSRTNPAENYLLERTVTHVNIPVGEKIYTSVYLSPSSVKSISGQDKANKGLAEEIAVLFTYQGRPIGGVCTKGDIRSSKRETKVNPTGWWTKLGGNKLMRSEKFPLLAKSETPFAPLWWDRYAEPKPEGSRR